jgi:hypothetical protein
MNRRRLLSRLALATAILMAAAARAQPTDRIPVSDVKPLLKRAIEQGYARGVMVGEAAAYVRQKFGSAAPIEIDVRALHALPQSGCSRLEVTTRQQDVLEQGRREDQTLTYQVSYCRDGRFPERK